MMRKLATFKVSLLAVGAGLMLSPIAPAQELDVVGMEIAKRTKLIHEAEQHIANGDRAFVDKNFEQAIADYDAALKKLPNAPIADRVREIAVAKYADASVKVAHLRADQGRYAEARKMLESVLEQNPDHEAAKIELEQLSDPDYRNPALKPEHVLDVQEVENFLQMGIGYYDLGDFDAAHNEFEKVLRIDPTNSAARRMLTKVEDRRIDYLVDARKHTRTKMLREVAEAWETPVAPITQIDTGTGTGAPIDDDVARIDAIKAKLNKIIIDNVEFRDTRLDEALEFLRIKSRDADPEGVNFIIEDGGDAGAANATITLESTNLPLKTALEYVCNLSGMKYKVDPYAVIITPRSAPESPDIYTRVFQVPPSFLDSGGGGGGPAAGPVDPFANPGNNVGGPAIKPKPTAQEVLETNNITFPPGTSAFFNKANSQLTVSQTATNMALIEQFVDTLIEGQGVQIHIQSKFLEVEQRDGDELGFDWLLGPFNLGTERAFGGGGVTGNSPQAIQATDFAFNTPGTGLPVGNNPITRGLRFGSEAITPDSIDGLLTTGIETSAVSTLSPGIFSIAGVFTDPQFQVIIRAISQKKGVDLMTAPSVTTKPGQDATIEVIREFIYPTEFEAPQIPQNVGGGGNVFGGGGGGNNIPVVPNNPSDFVTRNVGVTMQVLPVVGADKNTIDLTISPEVVEFEGFINYGSPIQVLGTDILGNPTAITLSSNRIEQPIFATRKVTTNVTVWDGQTVAIGGLIREDAQIINDKIPVIGDLPIIGRLFQTNAEEYFKRNLIIFVTCRLIRPDGRPLNPSIGERQRRDPVGPIPPLDPQDLGPGSAKDLPMGMGGGKNVIPGFGS